MHCEYSAQPTTVKLLFLLFDVPFHLCVCVCVCARTRAWQTDGGDTGRKSRWRGLVARPTTALPKIIIKLYNTVTLLED
jgi:hypothetical protein